MSELDLIVVTHSLLRKQHLLDNSTDELVQIVRDIGGLHGTIPKTPYLSLFSRTKNFTKQQLDEELYTKRSLGRIRCVRKTVYVLPKELLSTAFSATKSMVELTSKRYIQYLGVTEQDYTELSQQIIRLLKGKGLTAKKIKTKLGTDLNVSAVMNLMCDQGLLIRGNPKNGWKSNLHTYYLFHDYFPDVNLNQSNKKDAIELLVQHYIASFGPVTENDIIWWTGLTKTLIQDALKKLEVVSVNVEGLEGSFLLLKSDTTLKGASPRSRVVNLLPALDSYIMGYTERKRFLAHQYYNNVFDRSGNAAPTILVEGKVVGVWDFIADKKPAVKILLFESPENSTLTTIYSKAQQIGKFIADKEVTVKQCNSMLPLPNRTAGGFMSPLKNS
jgi:hypothetical protein